MVLKALHLAAAALVIDVLCAQPTPPGLSPCQTNATVKEMGFCDPARPAAERARMLVTRLSNAEKQYLVGVNGYSDDGWASRRYGLHAAGYSECSHASGSPHGSPAHPVNLWRVTVFPQVMSSAQSWSRSLISSIAEAISLEGRAKHNNESGGSFGWKSESSLYCFAPMINVCRDVRWGRCQEGYGESPFLSSVFAALHVEALQGSAVNGKGQPVLRMLATPKHFDVFSGPGNMFLGTTVSTRDLVEYFQPSFRAAVVTGKARSVMCAYNSVNGTPSCANPMLLTDLLRDDWKFDGHVVSDCAGVYFLWKNGYARSEAEAVAMAIRAGVDANCGTEYSNLLEVLVRNGTVAQSELDRAALRVLTNRMLLGELEDNTDVNPFRNLTLAPLLRSHAALARRAAREAIVLLHNEGGFLPLSPTLRSVAVVGPMADDPYAYLGDYAPQAPYYTTAVSAARVALDRQATVSTAAGCSGGVWCTSLNLSEVDQAVAGAEVVVLVVGTNGTFNEYEGEGRDRPSVGLPGRQEELVQHVMAGHSTHTVVAFVGAPTASPAAYRGRGVLHLGYGGQEAGSALWDVLLGTYNPSGRLVNTWPASDDQLPPMTDYNMRTPPGRTYRYLDTTLAPPMHRFGDGLSYTTFSFGGVTVTPSYASVCDVVEVTGTVANTGHREGDVVVQVYLQYSNQSVPTPLLRLVAFTKEYSLRPTETRTVHAVIPPEQRDVVYDNGTRMVVPGTYIITLADHQPPSPSTTRLTVAGHPQPLSHCSTPGLHST